MDYSLDQLKTKYRYKAEKFQNIIKKEDIPELLNQVAVLKSDSSLKSFIQNPNYYTLTIVLFKLQTKGGSKFGLIGHLGSALLTIHNTSTVIERGFIFR